MLNRVTVRRLARDRRAVAAMIVAVTLPAVLVAAGLATEAALIQVRVGELQMAADAAAGAGRQALDPYQAGAQSAPVSEARLLANRNLPSSLAAGDVQQGWWNIKTKTFGASEVGQTGGLFNNAVRITTRMTHDIVMGRLMGRDNIALSRRSIGYKCSNLDYPLTLIPDDPNPPTHPTVWLAWASDGYPANTSYYYLNTGGRENPVIKFYSPTDADDVSFVVTFSDGSKLQMDTYCKGTFLIVPDAFNWKGRRNITATVKRGSTNNSFATYPNQAAYPTYMGSNVYSATGTTNRRLAALRPEIVKVTPYPSSNGIQYWASEGNPTPDRRTILVQPRSDL